MTAKEIILEQMAACNDLKNWFVSVKDALDGLNSEQAGRNDGGTNNSIWQIVNHLIFWNNRYMARFKGVPQPKLEGGNDATFKIKNKTDEEWNKTVETIGIVLTEFQKLIADSEENKFNGPAFEGTTDSWFSYLANITIHNAYHIGQIVTLRKQHGNWNQQYGVK